MKRQSQFRMAIYLWASYIVSAVSVCFYFVNMIMLKKSQYAYGLFWAAVSVVFGVYVSEISGRVRRAATPPQSTPSELMMVMWIGMPWCSCMGLFWIFDEISLRTFVFTAVFFVVLPMGHCLYYLVSTTRHCFTLEPPYRPSSPTAEEIHRKEVECCKQELRRVVVRQEQLAEEEQHLRLRLAELEEGAPYRLTSIFGHSTRGCA